MTKREEATPETDPNSDRDDGPAPTVKEESEADKELADDQETFQPDSS